MQSYELFGHLSNIRPSSCKKLFAHVPLFAVVPNALCRANHCLSSCCSACSGFFFTANRFSTTANAIAVSPFLTRVRVRCVLAFSFFFFFFLKGGAGGNLLFSFSVFFVSSFSSQFLRNNCLYFSHYLLLLIHYYITRCVIPFK